MSREPPKQRLPAASGFTLVELLVALAVTAILSAMAWPGYRATLQRAQRNDARLALLQLQVLQEGHYASHLRYAGGFGSNDDPATLRASDRSISGHYRL